MKSDKTNAINVILGVTFSILGIGLIFLLAYGLLKFEILTYNESLLMSFLLVIGIMLLFQRYFMTLERKVAAKLNNVLSERTAKTLKIVLILILMAPLYMDLLIRLWELV